MSFLLSGLVPSMGRGQADPIGEVFYQFMPIAWRDSDSDAYRFGDFGGMTASLEYLEDLGITAIWMNPIFPSPAYHGYQHGRADEMNSRHGTEADFVDFLEAAHARGIKVFVDFVAYGISHDSPWFQDAYGNPSSPYDDWLAFTNAGNTEYFGSTYPTWNGATVGFIHWDLRSPGPVELVTSWARRLLDPNADGIFTDGLDGFRLDHVWQTYPNGPDGWGYHIDSFWDPWRQALREVNPDVFVFAEQADWGSNGTELFSGMDAAFTKPFEFAARDALAGEDAGRLYNGMASTLAALDAAPNPGTLLCIIGDHDVDRLASVIGDDFAKGKAAAAVLLTQPFPPVIYYGDEIGMRGRKNTGYSGDAADIPMREPFKWNRVAGPPMSNYFVLNGPAYSGRISRDNDGRSVEEQAGATGSLLEAYRELIHLRKANVALTRGSYNPVEASRPQVWSFVRYFETGPEPMVMGPEPARSPAFSIPTASPDGSGVVDARLGGADQTVLVAINVGGTGFSVDLDLAGYDLPPGGTVPRDLLTGELLPAVTESNRSAYPLVLAGYGYRILEIEATPPVPPPSLVDGRGIPDDFGPDALLATQDNGTSFGDNVAELNQLFLSTRQDSLFLGLTGNLENDGTGFVLCFDTGPGGQNILDLSNIDPPPSGPRELTGLRFDSGFAPDLLYFVNSFGTTYWIDRFELLDAGGADKQFLGSGTVNLGSGELNGGANPHGFQLALDDTNVDGVTENDVSGADTATSGFELFLPFEELGLSDIDPTLVGLTAFLVHPGGAVGNQWLPGLGGGFGSLGFAPDLRTVPGDQHLFVTLDPESTGTGPVLPGDGLQLRLTDASPSRGNVQLSFGLLEATDVDLSILDTTGRRMRTLHSGPLPAGSHEFVWRGERTTDEPAPSGVYFARLTWTNRAQSLKFVLLR